MFDAGTLIKVIRSVLGSTLFFCRVSGAFSASDEEPLARFLQSEPPFAFSESEYGCNTILGAIPQSEIRDFLTSSVKQMLGDDSETTALFSTFISRQSSYGVQVRIVCASCSEFDIGQEPYQKYCGTDAYGFNETFSGLLVLPLGEDGDFPPGTLPGLISARGTDVRSVPSNQYDSQNPDPFIFLTGLFPASTGIPSLMPDYFGYGVSNSKIYKAYVIRQSYETSIVPLWYKAAQILSQESDCKTELANELAIMGYSEGGYSAPVTANALHELGWKVLRAYAGAIPAKVGSISIPFLIRSFDQGLLSRAEGILVLLLSSAYSSTYRDVANYNTSQNMLNESERDAVVELVNIAAGRPEFDDFLGDNDWLRFVDPDLLAWAREIYSTGDVDPCKTRLEIGFNDKLCRALRENDLTEVLENAPFPIHICHGRNDSVILPDNLPNFTKNKNLSLQMEDGSHDNAALPCLFTALLYVTSGSFINFPVEAKHSANGCPASGMATLPGSIQSSAPSAAGEDILSDPSSSSTHPSGAPFQSGAAQWSTRKCVIPVIGLQIVLHAMFVSGKRTTDWRQMTSERAGC